jgi:hypothetical protein
MWWLLADEPTPDAAAAAAAVGEPEEPCLLRLR